MIIVSKTLTKFITIKNPETNLKIGKSIKETFLIIVKVLQPLPLSLIIEIEKKQVNKILLNK